VPKISEIRKTLTAVVTGLLGWGAVVIASPSSAITAPEWLMFGVVAATSLGVYAVSNTPGS
jgi:hypothetical protein